jgi:aromatic ring-opening dioxygenase catalytic subunit (LigB family)
MRGYGDPRFTPISKEFDHWLTKTIEADPVTRQDQLIHWRAAPQAEQCHPIREEEHLLPLMVVAGAARDGNGAKGFSDCVLETTISGFVIN